MISQICGERNRYIEPFLGGGVTLLNISFSKRVGGDINSELINSFRVVRDSPHDLRKWLYRRDSTKSRYDKYAKTRNDEGVDGAGRFIYLNRHSFGGLWRVNRSGCFNVPFGGPRGYERLRKGAILASISNRLEGVELVCGDYKSLLEGAEKRDVFFCDPVYRIEENSRVFDRYTCKVFAWDDLVELIDLCKIARQKGARVLLTVPESTAIQKLVKMRRVAITERRGAFGYSSRSYTESIYCF